MEVDSVRCRVPGHQDYVLIQRASVESVIRVCQNLQTNAKLQNPTKKNTVLIYPVYKNPLPTVSQTGNQLKQAMDVFSSSMFCHPLSAVIRPFLIIFAVVVCVRCSGGSFSSCCFDLLPLNYTTQRYKVH